MLTSTETGVFSNMGGNEFKVGIFAIVLLLLGPPAWVQGQGDCEIANIPVQPNFQEDKVCVGYKN